MRRYGQWAGNPQGDPEDPERCAEWVLDRDAKPTLVDRQCGRKRGKGPHGLYCAQHAKQGSRGPVTVA